MGQEQNQGRVQRYVPSLEGIRGYGFLLVFCGHYFLPKQLGHPGTVRLQVLTCVWALAYFAVPSFFVLSGYLIGGILYDTRNREGYFRVFYSRRFLRVFPVYYLTLMVIAGFYWLQRIPLDEHFWTHFLYAQNLLPSYPRWHNGPISMVHFWSLAVEEQFYLLWPIVVWCFPERRKLIVFTSLLIGACCSLRLAMPLIVTDPQRIPHFTPTRADAILLGVVLALVRKGEFYERIKPFAKWVVLSGAVTMAFLAIWKGEAWANTFWGEEILIPLANLVATAIVIAVMEENSLLNRICSQRWVCRLGSLSYSLYVFHMTFRLYFTIKLTGQLEGHMRQSFAVLLAGLLALCLTILLSILSYFLIEGPIMKLKKHVRHGARVAEMPVKISEPVLAETGT